MTNIIKKCFNLIFIICFGYILYNAIFHNGVNLFRWDKTSVVVGTIVNILILLLIYKYILEKEKINTKIVIPILLLIIFIFQCYIGNLFRVQPNWDMKELFNGASDYISGGEEYLNYLYRYPNNIGIQIIYIILFRIADFIKILSRYDMAMLFNIIMIDLALLFTFLVSKEMFDNKKALMIFIMLASMTPIYLFSPIIYTDTISMMFPVLILYLYLLAKKKDAIKKKCIFYALMGATICIGMSIKVTIAIMPIAISIYEIVMKNKRETLVMIGTTFISFIICLLFIMIFMRLIFPKWNNEEYNKERFPITHWIMMGLGDVGKYSERDVALTSSFSNINEKRKENMKVIQERLANILENRKMNHLRRKLMYTWGDGTYYAVNTLDYDAVNNGKHQEFVFKRGEHHEFYQYYTQIQHLTIITLMIVLSFISIKKDINYEFTLRIAIFGLFLFLLLWETRSRYLINHLPVMQIISFIGVEELYKVISNVWKKHKLNLLKEEKRVS